MSFESIHDACRSKFDDLADLHSIQAQYDNAPFEIDEDSLGAYNTWARPIVLCGNAQLVMIGGNKTARTPGNFKIQLRTPVNSGDELILQVADLIKVEFRTNTSNGVTFRTPYINVIGRERNWYRVDVNCPFYSDDVYT